MGNTTGQNTYKVKLLYLFYFFLSLSFLSNVMISSNQSQGFSTLVILHSALSVYYTIRAIFSGKPEFSIVYSFLFYCLLNGPFHGLSIIRIDEANKVFK